MPQLVEMSPFLLFGLWLILSPEKVRRFYSHVDATRLLPRDMVIRALGLLRLVLVIGIYFVAQLT